MKKLLLFLCFIFVSLAGFAKNDFLPISNQVLTGDTVVMCNVSACSGDVFTFNIPSFLGFTTSCSYFCDGIRYNTTEPYILIPISSTISDTTIVCYIDSINGLKINKVRAIVITVNRAPTISIPTNLVKHVTCPDGYLYPYADGSFHVDLDDPVQDYEWIKAEVDTPFFFVRTFYDTATLTSLKAGTYHVIARGVTGCEYHDSVIIEQPEPWYIDYVTRRVDTVCKDSTGCINIAIRGATPPYNFTWFYYDDTNQIFMPDTSQFVCGLYSGMIYYVYMYDSRGCKFLGDETEGIFCYLFEYVEDSTNIITTDSIACYGREFIVQAQSMGEGTYTWYIGDQSDSVNYWTSIYGDSMFVADYITPPITEPTWIYAEFSDQHHCVTRDSIWVDVYNSNISLTIETPNIVTDSTCTVQVFPPGGNLFVDGVIVGYNIPSNYTFSTDGISVGSHTLRYAGTFGAEVGVGCDDETSQTIQVETNPFVPDWEYEISIYPNPATTILNLSSTGMSDFELSILDITGKVIKTEKMLDQTFTFDVSGLASGMYMLRLVSHDGASKVVKFVKR